MEFTFFADLVGISSLYRAEGDAAYNALNDFYNEVFYGLDAFHGADTHNREVHMLSDSILVSGEDIQVFVESMAPVYANLLKKGLMLRGGAVRGKIHWDTRIQSQNFRKMLPQTDVLARAASFEKSVKGARFLLDGDLARHLQHPKPQWLTEQGYINDRCKGDDALILQRAVVPLPNGAAWEVLYPLLAGWDDSEYQHRLENLREMEFGKEPSLAVQYRATETLLHVSQARSKHHRNAGAVTAEDSYEKLIEALLIAKDLSIRELKVAAGDAKSRLDWVGEAPRHGGVYAFWWDGNGQSSLSEMAGGKHLHFKGPDGHGEFDLDVTELIGRRLQNGLTPLYVGKSFSSIADRVGKHLCLGSRRVVSPERCGAVSPRKTTTCQLRDRLDRLFPQIDDTRILLKNIKVSWVELCGKDHFSQRFFLEDLAIGIFRPAFNVDSER